MFSPPIDSPIVSPITGPWGHGQSGVPGDPIALFLERDGFEDSIGEYIIDRSGNGNDMPIFSYCPNLAGTEVLTLGHVTPGITIVQKVGTSTPTIGSGQITFSAGTIRYISLSDGTELVFEGKNGEVRKTIYNSDGTARHGNFAANVTFNTLVAGSFLANGYLVERNDNYPSNVFSSYSYSATAFYAPTITDGISAFVVKPGTFYNFVRTNAVTVTSGQKYTGIARFKAINHRYIGFCVFSKNPYTTARYSVIDTLLDKVVFGCLDTSDYALEKDVLGFYTLTYTTTASATSSERISISLVSDNFYEEATLVSGAVLYIEYMSWVNDSWINHIATTTATINRNIPTEGQNWRIKQQAQNISCWGDSHTEGNRWDLGIYPMMLEMNTPGRTVYNGGFGGKDAAYISGQMSLSPEKFGDITVIWVGHNGIQEVGDAAALEASTMATIAEMVARLTTNKYVVLTLVSILGEPESFAGLLATAINNNIIATYPNNHIDIRTELAAFNDGSANDLADIANGYVPRSLRVAFDNPHHNKKGHGLVAHLVGNFIHNNIANLAVEKEYIRHNVFQPTPDIFVLNAPDELEVCDDSGTWFTDSVANNVDPSDIQQNENDKIFIGPNGMAFYNPATTKPDKVSKYLGN